MQLICICLSEPADKNTNTDFASAVFPFLFSFFFSFLIAWSHLISFTLPWSNIKYDTQIYLFRSGFLFPMLYNTLCYFSYFTSLFSLWTQSNKAHWWHKYWVKGLWPTFNSLFLCSDGHRHIAAHAQSLPVPVLSNGLNLKNKQTKNYRWNESEADAQLSCQIQRVINSTLRRQRV